MSPFVHLVGFDVPGDSEDTWSERTRAAVFMAALLTVAGTWKPPTRHPQMNGQRRCGTYTQGSISQPQKE